MNKYEDLNPGWGGGLVVKALSYCPEDLSWKHSGYSIRLSIAVREKAINEKEAGVGQFFKSTLTLCTDPFLNPPVLVLLAT